MEKYVSERVKVVMFNLGYLPGYDHTCITRPQSTVEALKQAMELLEDGGLITVVVYTGHSGGLEESREVERLVSMLPQSYWDVVKFKFPNRKSHPPYLVAVQKR